MAYNYTKSLFAFLILLFSMSFCNRQKAMYHTLSGSMHTPYYISYQWDRSLDPEIGQIMNGLQHPALRNCSLYCQSADSILEFAGHCIPQIQATKFPEKVSGTCFGILCPDNGFICDTLSQLFDSRGIHNYKIQIGGRIITKGVDARQKAWRGEMRIQKIPK